MVSVGIMQDMIIRNGILQLLQQKLGIAWVRDESNWKRVVEENLDSDPDLDYLDRHHICWLNLFGYINSFDGIQNDKGVWTWNKDVSILKKYVN